MTGQTGDIVGEVSFTPHEGPHARVKDARAGGHRLRAGRVPARVEHSRRHGTSPARRDVRGDLRRQLVQRSRGAGAVVPLRRLVFREVDSAEEVRLAKLGQGGLHDAERARFLDVIHRGGEELDRAQDSTAAISLIIGCSADPSFPRRPARHGIRCTQRPPRASPAPRAPGSPSRRGWPAASPPPRGGGIPGAPWAPRREAQAGPLLPARRALPLFPPPGGQRSASAWAPTGWSASCFSAFLIVGMRDSSSCCVRFCFFAIRVYRWKRCPPRLPPLAELRGMEGQRPETTVRITAVLRQRQEFFRTGDFPFLPLRASPRTSPPVASGTSPRQAG